VRRQIKEAGLACLTFTGVASLYTAPIIILLTSGQTDAVTTIYHPAPQREVFMQIALDDSLEVESATEPAEVAENSNTNVDSIGLNDHNIEKAPIIVHDVENINLPTPLGAAENINLEMSASVASQGDTPRKVKKRRRRRNRYANCQDNDGINVTDNGFAVGRAVVDHYAHITRSRKLGHVSWHKGDSGERDGFRVRRINCDLREAGIRNGDVVNTVNGQTVQSIPEAIVLWFKVRRRDRVVLEITRRGQPLTISYDLT
jgi:hypothetical protein